MWLVDLALIGGKYTWKRGVNHTAAARLDRFLISEDWDVNFKNMKPSILQRVTLDHTPLSLLSGNEETSKSYFKFENLWLDARGFIDRLKDWWDSFCCTGRSDYILSS